MKILCCVAVAGMAFGLSLTSGCKCHPTAMEMAEACDGMSRATLSFSITDDPTSCTCDFESNVVSVAEFRAAVSRLSRMPTLRELDLTVTRNFCWKDDRDWSDRNWRSAYEKVLGDLAVLTNLTSLSLSVGNYFGPLDLSPIAHLPIRRLGIDCGACSAQVRGLEKCPIETLKLDLRYDWMFFNPASVCALPQLKTVECPCGRVERALLQKKFPTIERFRGAGIYPPELPACIRTNGITRIRYHEWGCLGGLDERFEIDFERMRYSVKVFRNGRGGRATEEGDLYGGCLADVADWTNILSHVERADFFDWPERFSNPHVCDGMGWRVDLQDGDKIVKSVIWYNDAPPKYAELMAIKRMVFAKFGGCSDWRKDGLLEESSVVRKLQVKGLSEQEIYRKIRDGEVEVD